MDNLYLWRNSDMERIIYKSDTFCAVAEDGVLVEYQQTNTDQQCGDILLGKIERMMPGLECAFVDIGRKRSAFLPMREKSRTFALPDLRSGMKAAVQIRKEETGEKGAFLTRDLAIAGKYLLLMPMNRYLGVSSRVLDESKRDMLREIGKEISEDRFGLVMRSASLDTPKQVLERAAADLLDQWNGILGKLEKAHAPGTVLYHQDTVKQMISDYETRGINGISEAEALPPDMERQLRAAEERTVRIDNGGNIVIDCCEAMTVIDVNTGSCVADKACGNLFLETNLCACEKIVSQIRLRNLSGIILIDFIDMEKDEDRQKVAGKLQELLQNDRRKTVLHGWTSLGIMEMTRKRTGT